MQDEVIIDAIAMKTTVIYHGGICRKLTQAVTTLKKADGALPPRRSRQRSPEGALTLPAAGGLILTKWPLSVLLELRRLELWDLLLHLLADTQAFQPSFFSIISADSAPSLQLLTTSYLATRASSKCCSQLVFHISQLCRLLPFPSGNKSNFVL